MRCPFCNQDNTRVVDSRPVEDTNSIRRRRLCDACGKRFTTYEKVETIPLTVIKKDQNRESYKRSKIQDGVLRACYKRPIPIERVEEMIDSIEGDIFRSEDREISSTKIGEIVMEHLKDLDARTGDLGLRLGLCRRRSSLGGCGLRSRSSLRGLGLHWLLRWL